MTGKLTTHVLDTSRGLPAAGVPIRLLAHGRILAETATNEDGRCSEPLLAGAALLPGQYDLIFSVGSYFAAHIAGLPNPPFLDDIILRFAITDAGRHTHIPLLVSPYGYSTYRGS